MESWGEGGGCLFIVPLKVTVSACVFIDRNGLVTCPALLELKHATLRVLCVYALRRSALTGSRYGNCNKAFVAVVCWHLHFYQYH